MTPKEIALEDAQIVKERKAREAKAKSDKAAKDREASSAKKRWQQVADALMKAGASRIEGFQPDHPKMMIIELPGRSDEYSARKIAKMTYDRLGDGAYVSVYDDTGKELARATDFGVKNP